MNRAYSINDKVYFRYGKTFYKGTLVNILNTMCVEIKRKSITYTVSTKDILHSPPSSMMVSKWAKTTA